MKILQRFIGLPWSRKRLYLEATLWLLLSWGLVRGLPFRLWSSWLGEQRSADSESMAEESKDPRVVPICRCIESINARLGGRLTCLMLAMAVHWMLRRRNIASSLVLGTLAERMPDQSLKLKAHAWVNHGAGVVLGGNTGEEYFPISSFVHAPPAARGQAR
ncbi:lasso peptide biosynthesis B2 protein [Halomonas sp. LR5S13]|uniref:lasso peptide biosynthesis B2 protein n=1 Tax=Halomonas rhizosphaerae TaxID=3043296 RepID=UPI0024A84CE4|nr:lasso peptide biosynthesis B2 protein [Halomonas rhizosphaerae]MDI5921827.1 lasso peptide biosynthesis B2 protein [Halomonas rhizosphaerae]